MKERVHDSMVPTKDEKSLLSVVNSLHEMKAKHIPWCRTKRGADLLMPRTENVAFTQKSPPSIPTVLTLTQIQFVY